MDRLFPSSFSALSVYTSTMARLKQAKEEIMQEFDESMQLVRDQVKKKLDRLETSPGGMESTPTSSQRGASHASRLPVSSCGPSLGK